MSEIKNFQPHSNVDNISRALSDLDGAGDPLPKLIRLFDALRPDHCLNSEQALRRWRRMLQLLEIPRFYDGLRSALLTLFAQRSHYSFYAESGLLPNTGFFSELKRKVIHRILPELIDPDDLRDCLRAIFYRQADYVWMKSIPLEDQIAFWRLLTPLSRKVTKQIAETACVLSRRVCAMGFEPELLRVIPSLRHPDQSPFVALNDELTSFIAHLDDEQPTITQQDKNHLLVLIEQCHDVVERANHKATASAGTSMSLSYGLTRLTQHLNRLELMVDLLAVKVETVPEEEVVVRWTVFIINVGQQELERNSLRKHFADLLGVISLLVTENAARTGEHYIAEDKKHWQTMLDAAAGAGVIIGIMALLKLSGYHLHLPVLSQGLLNGFIYGGGFVVVHLLHFTIATKQPAMTAAKIAATISHTSGRLKDQDKLVDLIVATCRSQFAAVVGNVSVAFPLAMFLGTIGLLMNNKTVTPEKAMVLLNELQPFSTLALFYAAIAGFWLFVTGLVTGYVDNMAAYSKVGPRVANLRWLHKLVGEENAEKVGNYISHNAGGLFGNFSFGMMLGLTPAFGAMLGLPLDIRHIAFSSANLGYALAALKFDAGSSTLAALAVLGMLLIGLVNLITSFSLALWVAVRSRGARFTSVPSVLPLLKQRFVQNPRAFFLPDEEEEEEDGEVTEGEEKVEN